MEIRRANGIQEVVGSIPIGSTTIFNSPPPGGFFVGVAFSGSHVG